jgi:hypothetical protein
MSNSSKPKVFVVNKGAHDHTDAERFGEIVYLSIGKMQRYATSKMYREFVEKMKHSSDEDYILLTGLSVMSSIACAIYARKHGRLRLLLFKVPLGNKGYYVVREIMIDELIDPIVDLRKNQATV